MSQTQPQTLPPIIEVPDWLMAEQPTHKRSPALLRQLTEEIYSNFFEVALEKVADGVVFRDICESDNRGISASKMMSWIKRDSQRERRYYDAVEVARELMVGELAAISDAANNPLEDVQRSNLRIETRKWLLKTEYKRRYGDTKHMEISQSLGSDHLTALAANLVALQKQPNGVYDVQASLTNDVTDVE